MTVEEGGILPDLKVYPVTLSPAELQKIAGETAVRIAAEEAASGRRVGALRHNSRTAPFVRVATGNQFAR